MASPEPIAYVFHGQDEPALRKQYNAFCEDILDPASADLNTTRLDGRSVQIGEIESACGSLPFLAEYRLVTVENLSLSNNAKALIEQFSDMLDGLPDTARLVLLETHITGSRTGDSQAEQRRKSARKQTLKNLINVVEKNPRGKVMSFDLPKDKNGQIKWVIDRAGEHGASIDREGATLLVEQINDDLVLADSELQKLATYVNSERTITRDDVDLLTPYSAEASIWHMVDAIGQRNGTQALKLMNQLLDDGDEPLRIFAMIVRQYRMILLMREQLDAGQAVNSAGNAIKVRDFVAKKLSQQARRYKNIEQLERIYRLLLTIDADMKTGQMAPRLALEQLIARLAR